MLSQTLALFQSPQRILEAYVEGAATAQDTANVIEACRTWLASSKESVSSTLRSTLVRVVVGQQVIRLEFSRSAIRQHFSGEEDRQGGADADPEYPLVVEVPAELTRFRGEVRFHLTADKGQGRARPVPSLVRAVARAHHWMDRIMKGEIRSQQEIAKDAGVDKRYISRIMPLAFLAPDIVEGILDGKQDFELRLNSSAALIPMSWEAQRGALARRVDV